MLRRSAAFEVPSVPQKTNSSPTFTPLCAVLKATPRPIGETGELVVNLDTKTVEMNGCPFPDCNSSKSTHVSAHGFHVALPRGMSVFLRKKHVSTHASSADRKKVTILPI